MYLIWCLPCQYVYLGVWLGMESTARDYTIIIDENEG